jgi:hypothetical protein
MAHGMSRMFGVIIKNAKKSRKPSQVCTDAFAYEPVQSDSEVAKSSRT